MSEKKIYSLRVDQITFDKIKIISNLNKRSIAQQIEFILDNFIKDFEKVNGKIELNKK